MEPQKPLDKETCYVMNVAIVREALKELAKRYPLLPGLHYTSLYDFLAKHGRAYKPGPYPGIFKQFPQRQCYGNALVMAGVHGFKYVEGVALAPTGEVIPHAWNLIGAIEALLDVTWLNTGVVYYGCEFSVERADDATWNGDAHVLNDEHRNYPVYQKPWTGEDYTLEWPSSDRLGAMRRLDGNPGASVLEYLESKGERWSREHPPI